MNLTVSIQKLHSHNDLRQDSRYVDLVRSTFRGQLRSSPVTVLASVLRSQARAK
jgi:hypothetical protein